jgi:hypothetical protein
MFALFLRKVKDIFSNMQMFCVFFTHILKLGVLSYYHKDVVMTKDYPCSRAY